MVQYFWQGKYIDKWVAMRKKFTEILMYLLQDGANTKI